MNLERLRTFFSYEPLSGVLRWRCDHGRAKKGARAGTPHPKGYLRVRLDGKNLYVHRVIWALVRGEVPPSQIDHQNGRRSDNRWGNLRLATPTTNQHNRRTASARSKTGVLGVGRVSPNSWSARITVSRRSKLIGCFPSPEAAYAAYVQAKRELHAGNLL